MYVQCTYIVHHWWWLTFSTVVRRGEVPIHHQSAALRHTLIAHLRLLYSAQQRALPPLLFIKQQGPAAAHGRIGQPRDTSWWHRHTDWQKERTENGKSTWISWWAATDGKVKTGGCSLSKNHAKSFLKQQNRRYNKFERRTLTTMLWKWWN